MDPTLVRAASTAGSALSHYAMRAVLGNQRRRALEGVYQRAIRRAVTEVAAATGPSDTDLLHAVGLLERLVSGAADGDVPLVASGKTDDRAIMARWRDAAAARGLAPDTFPVPFEALVDTLLRAVVDEATHTAVDADGNALFPAVAVAHLEALRESLRTLAHLTPLDGQVRHELQAAERGCRNANRALVTPDVLLALLHLANSSVAACFDAAEPGLAARVRRSLQRYLQATAMVPFRPFEWVERAEIRQAQTYAWVHGRSVVTGPILFLGVLDTPSNTRNQLADRLGPNFDVLRDAAVTRADEIVEYRTPGTVFPDTLDAT